MISAKITRQYLQMLPINGRSMGTQLSKSLCVSHTRKYVTNVTQWKSDQMRSYSSQPSRNPGFIGKFVDNLRQEMTKSKEMKENLKKFRQEAEKLEHSEALKKARLKYQTVESEASKGSEVLKERIDSIKHRVQDVLDEAAKTELAKKAGQIKEELSKAAQDAAGTISKGGSKIGQTGAFRTISETAQKVKEEIDQSGMGGNVYRAPKVLRKRVENVEQPQDIKPNKDATGVDLHKDSKFSQSWQNFKENNPYVNKIWDWKMQYDESENPMVRASRFVTEKVTDLMGGLFQKTELSETLTEICKLDPNFEKVEFLKMCEDDIIPNVLEAIVRGDLEILKDWCHEGPFNVISTPIKLALESGCTFHSKILDIDKTDLVMGKMMDSGPVLIISFQAQQILCLRDKTGKVVEGDPDKVLRADYVWALCRDPTELNPRAAWKLIDMSANYKEQLL